MKNILFFLSSTKIGGAETNVLKISRELSTAGYHIYWCFLLDDGPLLKQVDFDLKGKIKTGLFYRNPVSFYKRYKNFIQSNKIDIVFNFGLRVEIASRILSKHVGVKTIISNIRNTADWRKKYHTWLDNMTSKSVDKWVANSEAGKKRYMERERISANKIDVIYNFFEPVNVSSLPLPSRVGSPLRIGLLANISENKGYFDLIALSKLLDAKQVPHMFIYAGYDKTDGLFQTDVIEKGLTKNFNYLGFISDKGAFFNQIDIFLLPSYSEGMPTSILEAMAFGKPVISTVVGGIPEVIDHNINGILVAPGDIQGLYCALMKVSGGGGQFLVKNANKKLEHFRKDNIMPKWMHLIETVRSSVDIKNMERD